MERENGERQLENSESSMQQVLVLEKLAIDACASMRIELGLPEDRAELIAMIEEAGARAYATLRATIARARERFLEDFGTLAAESDDSDEQQDG